LLDYSAYAVWHHHTYGCTTRKPGDGGWTALHGRDKGRKFRAFDRDTGLVLWETSLPAGGYATPATYAVDGRQYVVIAAGGGKMGTRSGDAYVAFALVATQYGMVAFSELGSGDSCPARWRAFGASEPSLGGEAIPEAPPVFK